MEIMPNGNTGVKFTEERKRNIRLNHADVSGNKNPNWRGDDITFIGIHLWLTKNFKKKRICEFCGKKSIWIDWAKLKNKEYKRERENFIELCRKCHTNYDRNKEYCINGHKQIPENLYNMKTGKRLCRLCNKLYRDRRKKK